MAARHPTDTTLSAAPQHHPGLFNSQEKIFMKNAISWFEIPTVQLDQAQVFYEAVLGCALRRESMGPSEGAVFPYYPANDGVGGALMCGPTAPARSSGGTLVYLDASPSLDAALARVTPAGGQVALPRQALPPGMGFFAHIMDLDGNRVGLHALA
jgi:predicted enzyme related to lactoylglutathione lyase